MQTLGYIFIMVLAPASAAKRMPPVAAHKLLQKMNRSVDPCENFYEYACGGFLENAEIKSYKFEASTLISLTDDNNKRLIKLLSERPRLRDIEPVRKAKLFYRSCLNQDAVEANAVSEVLDYLNSEGGAWPTFDSSWDENDFDLELSLAAAQRLDTPLLAADSGPMIRTWVAENVDGPGYLIYIEEPGFDIDDFDFISDSLELLGADKASAEADAQAMIELNNLLSQLPMDGAASGTVAALATLPGTFDWMKYLSNVFRDTEYTVQATDPIRIQPLSYYLSVIPELNSASKRVVANLIKWRTFRSLYRALPDAFLKRQLEQTQGFTGLTELFPREEFCANVVNGDRGLANGNFGMGQAVARILIDRYYKKREKFENEKFTDLQVATLTDIFQNNEWLSEETKETLISKVRTVTNDRVYPNTTFDDEFLQDFYRDFDIGEESYAKNFINSVLGNTRRVFENLLHPRYQWLYAGASGVGAYANYLKPLTVVTAALLSEPVYDPSYPIPVKLGSGGFVSGHELFHLIGIAGRRWTEDGDFVPLGITSEDSTTELFGTRIPCLIDQYNQYDVPNAIIDGLTVNGAMSIEENLADNIGLKIAYRAYGKMLKKTGDVRIRNLPFKAKELFFISYAQTFCETRTPQYSTTAALFGIYSPGKWRINGPLRNLPEFAETFNCPAESFMNPEERCVIY